ncbi:hypothetical protein AXF42_Ash008692 [Apostasia shenzhenica]|uniref:DUF3741 domain-containing protein n=1 Tax=Apostasia shenzhenica TaxID=1088818 RepID=A0A2I0B248_9ASPA|nr:hypothetical protein AXF42_Ash008692 [Apostasia shenzhenica]
MGNGKKRMRIDQHPSSRRNTPPDDLRLSRKMAVGCMSGIVQFLCRRHSRCRISYAGKGERIENPAAEFPARSPTIPSEIRRPPGLVARLMGLEDPPPADPPAAWSSLETPEEKRRKLLGALERCDEHLRALNRIITALRTEEVLRRNAAGDSGDSGPSISVTKCRDSNSEEQPSPVSVLDASSSPKLRSEENEEEAEEKARGPVDAGWPLRRLGATLEPLPRRPDMQKIALKDPAGVASAAAAAEKPFSGMIRWARRSGAAIAESAGGVPWERREVEGAAAELGNGVVADLVEELVMELVVCCSRLSLPRSCKRKLSF